MKTNKKNIRPPTPDFEPIPGSVPKKFPDQPVPLGNQPDPSSPAEDDEPEPRSGSGEDTLVESGLPDNDPEQPRETDEEKSLE